VAVNPVTNQIYVATVGNDKVTVFDGVTHQARQVPAGDGPWAVAVNPVTNKIYVTNHSSDDVTVIDGVTNDTALVPTGAYPRDVAVNPITNKIYVANASSNNVTVIDGATNGTIQVSVDSTPGAVAVNPITNKIYVANSNSATVTVIDGATNATTTVPAGSNAFDVVVNPVTNKIYVANLYASSITVIDGATNATTTVPGGSPCAVAVNPVTDKIYVANMSGDNVTVIADAPGNDTKVRSEFERLAGDTTSLACPPLTGKGVNRWTPGRTAMMGVGNRMNTAQTAWDWATVTAGAGTDSIMWIYNWGADSLILGENFVCCVPLEDQAATTNNLGLGTPFAGNLEVYPVYRMEYHVGVGASPKPQASRHKLEPTIVRGVLVLPGPGTRSELPERNSVMSRAALLDISGRKVLELHPGANDVRALAPGVYFAREAQAQAQAQAVRKVVVTR